MQAHHWSVINYVSFGITSTADDEIQHGVLQTRVANCQLVSVKRNDFCTVMHRVRILYASSSCRAYVKENFFMLWRLFVTVHLFS